MRFDLPNIFGVFDDQDLVFSNLKHQNTLQETDDIKQ